MTARPAPSPPPPPVVWIGSGRHRLAVARDGLLAAWHFEARRAAGERRPLSALEAAWHARWALHIALIPVLEQAVGRGH